MAKIIPFRGVRPKSELAGDIIALPYDVLNEAEARAIVASTPKSFLRITRSEVDLAEGSDSHSREAYQKAKDNLDQYLADGWMIQDEEPCFYLYRQTWQSRTQYGLMALCDTEEYDQNLIKKHELTRPDKEQDRTDHISIMEAQTGLVFLSYRDQDTALQALMTELKALDVEWAVETDDDVEHGLTVISDASLIARLQKGFEGVEALYIADGHHRSAAASRVAKDRNREGTSGFFMAGIFADSELKVLPYNRVVHDLNGHTIEEFLTLVAEKFVMSECTLTAPVIRGTISMYLAGKWLLLDPKPEILSTDVVETLDASILQDNVLAPILGVENPRTDTRISFVGGIRGTDALEKAVAEAEGTAVAFSMFATGMDQLLAVADADRLMPPKCTWFEPKLRGGVLVHKLASA